MTDTDNDQGDALQRGHRLQLMLNPQELRVIDDFRFRNRMPSRAAAVRELMKRGLKASDACSFDPPARSTDFGVVDRNGAAAPGG